MTDAFGQSRSVVSGALGAFLLASCAAAANGQAGPASDDQNNVAAAFPPPTGARIEPSGFGTILSAPPEPYPAAPPRVPQQESEPQRLARAAGISVAEAETRMNPDQDSRRAATALRQRLRLEARGNFVDAKIVRDPLPRFVFYFRNDAAATLRRFTSDPRFSAVEGGVPEEELMPIFEEWRSNFAAHRLMAGGSVNGFEGVVELHIAVSRPEFEAIVAREGWRIPPRLRLSFAREIDPATLVTPDVAPFIRIFPRADRATGGMADVMSSGRIVLRDGCFRLDGGTGGDPLILFGRETRLSRDSQSYLVVSSLANPDVRARIGETMTWGGSAAAMEDVPGLEALRAKCGAGPIHSVGAPVSATFSRIRPWAIESYAQTRRISLQSAWDEIKACWAREDARRARARAGDRPAPQRECDPALAANPPPPPRRR